MFHGAATAMLCPCLPTTPDKRGCVGKVIRSQTTQAWKGIRTRMQHESEGLPLENSSFHRSQGHVQSVMINLNLPLKAVTAKR